MLLGMPVPGPAALAKVRKLLALATSPNPHEAALAAATAQTLIETHRLHAWIDAQRDVTADPDPIVDAREVPLEQGRRIRKWKIALAGALADANCCVAYVLGTGTNEAIVLVGRSRDRNVAAELWHWLVRRIEWLSATHGAGKSRQWHDAFRVGVVDAVAERLAQAGAEARTQLDATALVIVDPARAAHRDALDRFVAEHLGLGRGRGMRVDASAYRRGQGAAAALDVVADPTRAATRPKRR